MFYPEDDILGVVLENQNFVFSIYYEEVDETTMEVTRYPVTITFNEVNPFTVQKVDGDPALISGYYFDSFDNSLQYRTPQDTFITTDKFEKIDRNILSEMVYYLADTRRTKVFTYTATANEQSKVYTIVVQNDWDNGKVALQTYVGFTR